MSLPISRQSLEELSIVISHDKSIVDEFIANYDDLTDNDFKNILAALESLSRLGVFSKQVRALRHELTLESHAIAKAHALDKPSI